MKLSSVILRQWRDSDFDLYLEMNTDPEVMRHFPSVLTQDQVSSSFTKLRDVIGERGWGVWAVPDFRTTDASGREISHLMADGFIFDF